MSEALEVRVLTGRDPALADRVRDLAQLRIMVFREFPYLYDGDLAYEQNYLRTYLECPESVIVLACAGRDVVGASTGLPLEYETAEFKQPFVAAGLDPRRIFYCGESVLLPAWRGRGLYRRFFAAREEHARQLGRFAHMVLCAVERAADHPRRPADYQPLDRVWAHFGYVRHPEWVTHFSWKDLDERAPSAKPMVFWEKRL